MSNKRPIDHPEAQSFAEHIRDNPDDHTSRLVYADWLDENGFQDHANEVRGDVEKPYGPKDDVNDRARRGVMLHQAGVDPVNGWKTEDIYHSQNSEEWEPDFGHTIYEHGVGQELIDSIANMAHHPGEHRILKGDPVYTGSHSRNSFLRSRYHDENTGYVIEHDPISEFLSLSRRLA